jgi:uncharacterized SAM-binding protein YcdF (DUF218 family)
MLKLKFSLKDKNWFLLWLSGILVGGLFFFYHRENLKVRSHTVSSWESSPTADCAIVLTGGAGRLREGIDLLARKQIQKLIIAGVNPKSSIRDIFSVLMLYPEVNEKDIILEKRSATTYGNAQQTIPLVEALRCKEVLLVTSFIHLHRAQQTFRAAFPQDVGITPYGVVGSEYWSNWIEVQIETLKSLFYSVWAY